MCCRSSGYVDLPAKKILSFHAHVRIICHFLEFRKHCLVLPLAALIYFPTAICRFNCGALLFNMAAVKRNIKDVLKVMFLSGFLCMSSVSDDIGAMRQEELVKLQWKHVDLARATARVIDPKNGEDRTVPLSSVARKILDGLTRSIGGRVFPTTTSAIKQSWIRAKERAKRLYLADCEKSGMKPDKDFLDDLRFHDLRHEATSRLVEKGLEILEVATITGHKDLRMLKRYTHLKAENLARKLG